jgi:uncharacterized membrane protein
MDKLTSSEKRIRIVLLTTLTCIATMVIKLEIPTGGYVNLGDGFVLTCGMVLGPLPGALSAGTGCALADLLGGYTAMAPATFVIKAFTATAAAICYRLLKKKTYSGRYDYMNTAISGAAGELLMVSGYFLYTLLLMIYQNNRLNRSILTSAIYTAARGIPYNLLQAAIGIMMAVILTPVIARLLSKSK